MTSVKNQTNKHRLPATMQEAFDQGVPVVPTVGLSGSTPSATVPVAGTPPSIPDAQSDPVAHHTPGPWRVGDAGGHVWSQHNGMCVAIVAHREAPTSGLALPERTEVIQANAKLIAAAPDLLGALTEAREALQGMRDYVDGRKGELSDPLGAMDEAMERADITIAKAR